MLFWKYQGAGNDFILVDQREREAIARADTTRIARLCDRHFGIGADGLILLQNRAGYDFEMVYFNADGRESSMCGNGGRCIAAFAKHLGVAGEHCRFWAVDGAHEARLMRTFAPGGEWVELHMQNVQTVEKHGDAYVLNTGSPHFVRFVGSVDAVDLVQEGRAVRYAEPFRAQGINVNLAQPEADGLAVRTYERGVEDETLACGTGVTAAAIAFFLREARAPGPAEIPVRARGGALAVRFVARPDGTFTDIWLCGPAQRVFSGEIRPD